MDTLTNFKERNFTTGKIAGWLFAIGLVSVGLMNILLVHPLPGIAYLIFSLVYFPPAHVWLKKKTGFSIPTVVKIVLAVIIVMFTLGVSDLGDMID